MAQIFLQTTSLDYVKTSIPVVKMTIIMILLTIVVSFQWKTRQLTVNNTFLNSDLEEDVYMRQPLGFIDPQHHKKVCKFKKALYGFKQAQGLCSTSYKSVINWGFVIIFNDNYSFIKMSVDYVVLVLVYVNDIILIGSNSTQLKNCITQLRQQFTLIDLRPLNFSFSVKVTHSHLGFYLC